MAGRIMIRHRTVVARSDDFIAHAEYGTDRCLAIGRRLPRLHQSGLHENCIESAHPVLPDNCDRLYAAVVNGSRTDEGLQLESFDDIDSLWSIEEAAQ